MNYTGVFHDRFLIMDEEIAYHIGASIKDAGKKCFGISRIEDAGIISDIFVKYKANSYIRRNNIDVLEYVNLQKEAYGSQTFTVNYALIPLYVPHDFCLMI